MKKVILEVIVGTTEELAGAIPCPDCDRNMSDYKAYVMEELSKAGAAGMRIASMRSVPMSDKTSDNFMVISWIEQAVKEYQTENELPEIVRIVCDSMEAAEQYKVVYNFYYADSKASRLQDDKWD